MIYVSAFSILCLHCVYIFPMLYKTRKEVFCAVPHALDGKGMMGLNNIEHDILYIKL